MTTAKKEKVKSDDMRKLYEFRSYLRTHPKLTYLFVELTDRCNLSCIHCGSSCDGNRRTYIDTELLLTCLDTVAEDFEPGSVMICLTGGEPMLHPDFYQIVRHIVRLGFPWGMTTNGTLIRRDEALKLKELGLDSITISLDGMEEMHDMLRNVKGSFKRTIRAIEELYKAEILVQVTTVIHKKNRKELDELYELMLKLKVSSWRVINLEPIGRALDNKELLLSKSEMKELLDYIRMKRYSSDTPIDVRFGCSHYLSYEYEREVRDNYFICGSGIYVGSILCNGDIYSCLDIERRKELIQGNIKNDRFSNVWYNRFKEFRSDRTLSCKACSECKEKEFCGGDSTHTWDFDENRPRYCVLGNG